MGAASSMTFADFLLPISVEDAHQSYYNSKRKDSSINCEHIYVYYVHNDNQSECSFLCCDCNQKIEDHVRIEKEKEFMEKTYDRDLPDGILPAEYSAKYCGIKLGLLKAFVEEYDCADWSSADVIRHIIKPVTEKIRCRAAELPWLRPYVGHAQTFISYAQQGKFGDVVAGMLDGGVADLDRLVWIDIFGVRQWPCRDQKMQLDFKSTVENCSSFVSICPSDDLDAFESMQWSDYYLKKFDLTKEVKRKIYFLRVWCLVESYQCSITPGMPYILKGGKYCKNGITGELEFEINGSILEKLQFLVNIENAEAKFEEDKERILQMVREGGGCGRLNSTIIGAISGAFSGTLLKGPSDYALPCAACGDLKAKEIVMRDPSTIFCAAACGFTALLAEMMSMGTFDMYEHDIEYGGTCLTWAAYGAHMDTSSLLLDNCLPYLDKLEDYMNATSYHGRSALMAASKYGHAEYMEFLIDYARQKDIDLHINAVDNDCQTAVMFCCIGGHHDALRVLIEANADLNLNDLNGSTALMKAVALGYSSCVSLLLDNGADPSMKDDHGNTALIKKKVEGVEEKEYKECTELVLNKLNTTTEGSDVWQTQLNIALAKMYEGGGRKQSTVHEYIEPTKKKDRIEMRRQDSLNKRKSVLQHAVKNKNIDTKMLADPILNKRISRMQARMRGFIGRKLVQRLIVALKFTNKSGNFAHRGSFHSSGVGSKILKSASTNDLYDDAQKRIGKPRPKPLMY